MASGSRVCASLGQRGSWVRVVSNCMGNLSGKAWILCQSEPAWWHGWERKRGASGHERGIKRGMVFLNDYAEGASGARKFYFIAGERKSCRGCRGGLVYARARAPTRYRFFWCPGMPRMPHAGNH